MGLHRIRNLGLCITLATGLFGETEKNMITVASAIQKRCKKWDQSGHPLQISISRGKLEGGMVEFEKSQFDVIGPGYDLAMDGLECACSWDIIVDSFTLDRWKDETIESELGFKENGRSLFAFRESHIHQPEHLYQTRQNNLQILENEQTKDISSRDGEEELQLDDITLETSPFKLARKNNGWMAFLGEFRFKIKSDEHDYQRSLKTKHALQTSLIQTISITIFCLLFGFIDYSVMEKCAGYETVLGQTIFVRYFVISPLLISYCFFIKMTSMNTPNKYGQNGIWRSPFFVAAFYGLFTYARYTIFRAKSCFETDLRNTLYVFLYSEIYNAAIYLVLSATIRPIFIFHLLNIWNIYSFIITFRFNLMEGFSLRSTLENNFILSTFPFTIYYGIRIFTDKISRKDFLCNKVLNQEIKLLTEEISKNERALLSTLNDRIYNDFKRNIKTCNHVLRDCAIICIGLYHIFDNALDGKPKKKFELISESISLVEILCKIYGAELLKASQDKLIIMINDSKAEQQKTHFTTMAMQFAFKMTDIFKNFNRRISNSKHEIRVAMNYGSIMFGLFGRNQFFYDCIGSDLNTSIQALELTNNGEILITEPFLKSVKDSSCIEYKLCHVIELNGEAPINLYSISHVSNVWGMFMGFVDWFGRDQRNPMESKLIEDEKDRAMEIESIALLD